jgi:CRP-like cAMP-binding protein
MLAAAGRRRINRGSNVTDDCLACGPGFLEWLAGDAVLREAWQSLDRRRVARGAVLQASGAPMDRAWFVDSGLLRSCFTDGDGRERNRGFHPEGHWAGAPPAQLAQRAPFAIEAVEASVVVELPHAVLMQWQARYPAVQAVLLDALATSMATLARREATLLMDSAEQRYRAFVAAQPVLAGRLPLHQIASYLGITNVALSRIRRRLKATPAGRGAI